MPDHAAGIDQARLDVFLFQPGVALQQEFWCVPGGEHTQDMFHCQPAAANDGLAAEDVRIHRDAFEKLLFVHWSSPAQIPIVNGSVAKKAASPFATSFDNLDA